MWQRDAFGNSKEVRQSLSASCVFACFLQVLTSWQLLPARRPPCFLVGCSCPRGSFFRWTIYLCFCCFLPTEHLNQKSWILWRLDDVWRIESGAEARIQVQLRRQSSDIPFKGVEWRTRVFKLEEWVLGSRTWLACDFSLNILLSKSLKVIFRNN